MMGAVFRFKRIREMSTEKPIAIYYEHPEWFRPLFAELDRRGTPYVRLDASCHRYDASNTETDFGLFFNRMSASAYLRGHGNAIFYTRNYLRHLERLPAGGPEWGRGGPPDKLEGLE